MSQFSDGRSERRENGLPVTDNSVPGLFEDVGFGVLVDGDDDLSSGAAGHVLAGAGDGDHDV